GAAQRALGRRADPAAVRPAGAGGGPGRPPPARGGPEAGPQAAGIRRRAGVHRAAGGAAALDAAAAGRPPGRAGGRPGHLGRIHPAPAQTNRPKPWLKRQWAIPAVGAGFVWRMEDLPDLYAEPLDPARPVACFDETAKQPVAETRVPLPRAPGRPERCDYGYERRGTANLFLIARRPAARRGDGAPNQARL